MKRFHAHVMVSDLEASVRFYSSLFGADPTVLKPDYAKWMLEDPRVNFAITAGAHPRALTISGCRSNPTKSSRQSAAGSARPAEPSQSRKMRLAAMPAATKAGSPILMEFPGRRFTPLRESAVYGGDAGATYCTIRERRNRRSMLHAQRHLRRAPAVPRRGLHGLGRPKYPFEHPKPIDWLSGALEKIV